MSSGNFSNFKENYFLNNNISIQENPIEKLKQQLSLCMQQNKVLRQQNAELIKKNKLLSDLAIGVEGGRKKRKTKSKRRKRKRITRKRQRGGG